MKKLFAMLIILVLATIAMAYLYFTKINEKEQANDIALHVATSQTALVFNYTNSKDFYSLMRDQDLFSAFLDSNARSASKAMIETFATNPRVLNMLDNQKIYLSIVPDSNGLAMLLCTQLATDADGKAFSNLLTTDGKASPGENGVLIIKNPNTEVYAAIKGKLIIVSPSKNVVASRLLIGDKGIDTNFENFIKESSRRQDNSLMKLFVNYDRLPELINRLRQRPDKYWSSLQNIKGYGALDYNFSKEKLIFHGNTVINAESSYFKGFADMNPQKFLINMILPAKTANYTMYGVDSFDALSAALAKSATEKRPSDKPDILKTVKEKYLLDLPTIMKANFKNQFITFQLNTGEKMGAVALVNGDRFQHLLTDFGTFYSPDIVVWKDQGVLYRLFGEAFRDFDQPYVTIKDNYLIFANNASTVQSYLNMYATEPLLINNTDYISFRNEFPSEGNISVYINIKNSRDLFQRNLKRTYARQLSSKSNLGSFTSFCFQLAGDKGKFQANMLMSQAITLAPDTLTVN